MQRLHVNAFKLGEKNADNFAHLHPTPFKNTEYTNKKYSNLMFRESPNSSEKSKKNYIAEQLLSSKILSATAVRPVIDK